MEYLQSQQSAELFAAHGGFTIESERIVCLSACQRIVKLVDSRETIVAIGDSYTKNYYRENFLLVIVRKQVLLRISMVYCIRRLRYLSREQLLIERQNANYVAKAKTTTITNVLQHLLFIFNQI